MIKVHFYDYGNSELDIEEEHPNECNRLIIPDSSSITRNNINIPVSKLIYITNSGLYCFNKIIIINAISPTPIIFIISMFSPKG